jgi:hypothetical protein
VEGASVRQQEAAAAYVHGEAHRTGQEVGDPEKEISYVEGAHSVLSHLAEDMDLDLVAEVGLEGDVVPEEGEEAFAGHFLDGAEDEVRSWAVDRV